MPESRQPDLNIAEDQPKVLRAVSEQSVELPTVEQLDRDVTETQPVFARAQSYQSRKGPNSDYSVPNVEVHSSEEWNGAVSFDQTGGRQADIDNAIIGERLSKLLEQDREEEEPVYDLIMENPLETIEDSSEKQGPRAEPRGLGEENADHVAGEDIQGEGKQNVPQSLDILAGTLDNLIDFLDDGDETDNHSDKPEQPTEVGQSRAVAEINDLGQTLDALVCGLSSDEETFGETEPANPERNADGEVLREGRNDQESDQTKGSVEFRKSFGGAGVDDIPVTQSGALSGTDLSPGYFPDLPKMNENGDSPSSEKMDAVSPTPDGDTEVHRSDNAEVELQLPSCENGNPVRAHTQGSGAGEALTATTERETPGPACDEESAKAGSTRQPHWGEETAAEQKPTTAQSPARRPELSKAKSLNELSRGSLSSRILEAGKRARMREAMATSKSMGSLNEDGPASYGSLPRTARSSGYSSWQSVAEETAAATFPRESARTLFAKARSLDDFTNGELGTTPRKKLERPGDAEDAHVTEKPARDWSAHAKKRENIAAKLERLDAVLAGCRQSTENLAKDSASLDGGPSAEITFAGSTEAEQQPSKKPDSEIFKVPEIPVKRIRNRAGRKLARRRNDLPAGNGFTSGSEGERDPAGEGRGSIVEPRQTRASALRERARRSDSDSEKDKPSQISRRLRSGEVRQSGTSEYRLRGRKARATSGVPDGVLSPSEDMGSASRGRRGSQSNASWASSTSEEENPKATPARLSASRSGSRASSASEDEKNADRSSRTSRARPIASRSGSRASSTSEDEKNADRSSRTSRARPIASQSGSRASSASEDEKNAGRGSRTSRARTSASRSGSRASSTSEDEKNADRGSRTSRARTNASRSGSRASSASEDEKNADRVVRVEQERVLPEAELGLRRPAKRRGSSGRVIVWVGWVLLGEKLGFRRSAKKIRMDSRVFVGAD